jgi:predicted ATPase/DNA-binding winged helix-turn-helix (wHTH) protein
LKGAVYFGTFTLYRGERRLERLGLPVKLGGRAFDLLVLLVDQAGVLVTKKEILTQVWPDLTVDEGTIRVHMTSLRKILGEDVEGDKYITNISGRGYCFVAELSYANLKTDALASTVEANERSCLPPRLTKMVGREEVVVNATKQLRKLRFLTITGPGGIGKTAVAVAIAHELVAEFDNFVYFFDLGSIIDPALVPSVIVSAFGLTVRSSDPLCNLINFLQEKRILIVLDNCEHVIETAAQVADRIYAGTSKAFILTTSREALNVEGESVFDLPSLDTPLQFKNLEAKEAMTFSAIQHFVERVASSINGFKLSDVDAPRVAEICNRLDGIPLAIELAAGSVKAYGITGTATLLGDRLKLLWQGRRTALPRHQTMKAALDWSFNLLSQQEQRVLCRLAVMVGNFSLHAAQAVVADDCLENILVASLVNKLVAKSLIVTTVANDRFSYRLLDVTKAYAQEKLFESGDFEESAKKHAKYFSEYAELLNRRVVTAALSDRSRIDFVESLANLRAALDWCFSVRRDYHTGIPLAVTTAKILLRISQLTECYDWSARAISVLDDRLQNSRFDMELRASLGKSLMFIKGNVPEVEQAFQRGLKISIDLSDLNYQFTFLGALHLFYERIGYFQKSLDFALKSYGIAKMIDDRDVVAAAHSLLGIAYQLTGMHAEASHHLRLATSGQCALQNIDSIQFGFDHYNRACMATARAHWFLGYPDKALLLARQTVDDAYRLKHPVTLCFALIWEIFIFIWTGNLEDAEKSLERFIQVAQVHLFGPYIVAGRGIRGAIQVKRGEVGSGVALIISAISELKRLRYEILTSDLLIVLAEGLISQGDVSSAFAMISEHILEVKGNGNFLYMSELLRIKGDILLAMEPAASLEAEECYRQSLEWAERQSCTAWKLRAAASFAAMLSKSPGMPEEETPLRSKSKLSINRS